MTIPIQNMRKALAIPLTLVALALTAVVPTAEAAVPTAPLKVTSTSLQQSGQQLVWRLQMSRPFAPKNLAPHRLSLCLVLQQGRGPAGTHTLCIRGPLRHQRRPTLAYIPPTGRHHAITTMIVRRSHSELTATFMPAAAGIRYRFLRSHVLSTYRPPGCRAGAPCQQAVLTPARPLRLHTPRLVGCVPRGPRWVFNGNLRRREIALTFDDGPSPLPPATAFVNLLHRMHVPATFFEIGDQIPTYDPSGAIERRMLAYGDMIGDHTWTHPDMPLLSPVQQRQQLLMTANAIRRRTGFRPCLFRAPYGAVDRQLLNVVHATGFSAIQWDVDPRDWALPGIAAIEQNVIANTHDGSIVLQHFGGGPRYQTLAALPDEIRTLRAEGYRFVTVTQLLGYRLIYR